MLRLQAVLCQREPAPPRAPNFVRYKTPPKKQAPPLAEPVLENHHSGRSMTLMLTLTLTLMLTLRGAQFATIHAAEL